MWNIVFGYRRFLQNTNIEIERNTIGVFWRRKGGDIMVTKKDLIIAILSTFCLTSTLFMIVPTRSTPSVYDPWADIDGDGKITILDVVALTSRYATTGDPTRNVNVTNWPEPYRIVDLEYNVSWSPPYYTATLYTGNVYVGDYSRFYVYAVPDLEKNVGKLGSTYKTNISLSMIEYNLDVHAICDSYEAFVPSLYITTFERYADGSVAFEPLPKALPEFKVQAPFVSVCLSLKSTSNSGWVVLSIRIFMRNE